MKIIIEINNEKQAERFLTWVRMRGDIIMGDFVDFDATSHVKKEAANRYAYVVTAHKADI
jgi:hypothetical protein